MAGLLESFDSSQYNGKAEIESEIAKIFNHHQTAGYAWKLRKVRFLHSEVATLQAVARKGLENSSFSEHPRTVSRQTGNFRSPDQGIKHFDRIVS